MERDEGELRAHACRPPTALASTRQASIPPTFTGRESSTWRRIVSCCFATHCARPVRPHPAANPRRGTRPPRRAAAWRRPRDSSSLAPAGGEAHREPERGVHEAIPLEHARLGALRHLEPVDPAQQRRARIAERGIAAPADLSRAHGVGRRALLRARVRVEEGRVARVAELETRREREAGQERRHAHRVVAGRGAQDLAALVGLALHLAAVRRELRRGCRAARAAAGSSRAPAAPRRAGARHA